MYQPGQIAGVGHDAVVGDVVAGHHPHGRATVEAHPAKKNMDAEKKTLQRKLVALFPTLWSALHWVGGGSGKPLSLKSGPMLVLHIKFYTGSVYTCQEVEGHGGNL